MSSLIVALLVSIPAYFILRSNRGTRQQRIRWAAFSVGWSIAFLVLVGAPVNLMVRYEKQTAAFGASELLLIAGIVGTIAIPWVIYRKFRRRFPLQSRTEALSGVATPLATATSPSRATVSVSSAAWSSVVRLLIGGIVVVILLFLAVLSALPYGSGSGALLSLFWCVLVAAPIWALVPVGRALLQRRNQSRG